MRLKDKRQRADIAVVTDEHGVVENYAVTACDNPVRDVEQDQFGPGRRAERS